MTIALWILLTALTLTIAQITLCEAVEATTPYLRAALDALRTRWAR